MVVEANRDRSQQAITPSNELVFLVHLVDYDNDKDEDEKRRGIDFTDVLSTSWRRAVTEMTPNSDINTAK